jgi:hypothetical protein
VATPAVDEEVFAVAVPTAIIEANGMIVVVAVELKGKLVEAEAFMFGGIALGFFDFVDHAAVHNWGVSFDEWVVGRREIKKHATGY